MRLCPPLVLAMALIACGFQLRGSNLEALKNSHVYVKSNGANYLAPQVIKQLNFAEVPMVNDPGKADYIIELGRETFLRSLLSVSTQTGKVQEYEITYNASLSISGPGGKVLLKDEPLELQRDITSDVGAVLGKFEEESTMHQEIAKNVADTVLRRFQAVTR